MFEQQGNLRHYFPEYLPGELIQLPSFYAPPIAFYFESYNETPGARVHMWWVAGNTVRMTEGSRLRITGMDATRKGLEDYVWVMQPNGHFLAFKEPAPTQPTPQPPVFS